MLIRDVTVLSPTLIASLTFLVHDTVLRVVHPDRRHTRDILLQIRGYFYDWFNLSENISNKYKNVL